MKKIFLIISLCFISLSVQAVAIQIQPSELKIEADVGVLTKQEIIIHNPDNNVAFYELYMDTFSDWIKIQPESFILESKEYKEVILEIKSKETGFFKSTLSVLAKPLSERKFKAESGVKIPVEIRINESKSYFLANIVHALNLTQRSKAIIYYILSLLLILTLIILYIRKKNLGSNKLKS